MGWVVGLGIGAAVEGAATRTVGSAVGWVAGSTDVSGLLHAAAMKIIAISNAGWRAIRLTRFNKMIFLQERIWELTMLWNWMRSTYITVERSNGVGSGLDFPPYD